MKPTHIFADQLVVEPKAMHQFHEAMACDFAVKGAVMPDIHVGYSLPIGSVVATEGVVVPAWVGYDIGCGVLAIKTTFGINDINQHKEAIFKAIYNQVPVGTNCHNKRVALIRMPPTELGKKVFLDRKGALQLGSLGSGNHFIEIASDDDHAIWIVIHCGSRGTGHGLAGEYMKIASNSDKAKEGHYGLQEDSANGQAYIADMNWALEYALLNRMTIAHLVSEAIKRFCHGDLIESLLINRNHNHAEKNNGLWIHRKGATHAEDGMMGVIPGNMRDGSFIVRGKGNKDALASSSHGAGRVMGRGKAKRELSLEEFKQTMEGITASVTEGTLDESPMAYKSIFEVMALQKDLVDVVAHVTPIINIKG